MRTTFYIYWMFKTINVNLIYFITLYLKMPSPLRETLRICIIIQLKYLLSYLATSSHMFSLVFCVFYVKLEKANSLTTRSLFPHLQFKLLGRWVLGLTRSHLKEFPCQLRTQNKSLVLIEYAQKPHQGCMPSYPAGLEV